VTPLAGVFYKKSESWVIEDLTSRGLMYKAEKIVHSYPFCYRCETPLYFNAVPAWFIDVQKIKPDLIAQNEKINWHPEYLKHGRFGKGLEGAPDWNVSRSRYWGTPMPIWKSGNHVRVVGSVEELRKWAVDPKRVESLTDIHREFLDDLEVWVDDECTMKGKRIPEVFDCWIESGSMPFASIHYPFEKKDIFAQSHPAQFIAEYIAQTRAWFYTLHVMSVGLFGKNTFENAVTTGTILAEDGNKMSKSKKNFPDPALVMEKYGVDALRFYLMASVVMKAENLNFSETGVKEVYQKVVSILWNVFSFYKLYVTDAPVSSEPASIHVLDIWILSRLNSFVRDATIAMDGYDTTTYCRLILAFLSELSTWYLRRSRDRIQSDTSSQQVFGWVIEQLVKVMAPVTPFITETIYHNLVQNADSVHLAAWPGYNESSIDTKLESDMVVVQEIVERAHAKRKELAIKLRQPLASVTITTSSTLSDALVGVLKDELNVLDVVMVDHEGLDVQFDTNLTPELEQMGRMRELVRDIQVARKEKGCKIDQRIDVTLPQIYKTLSEDLLTQLKRETLVDSILWSDQPSVSITK
jgi:isoleucyl-tRNA synthetase